MSNDMDMGIIGFGAATRARIETNRAQQIADEERRKAIAAQAALANATTDRDLERKVRVLGQDRQLLEGANAYLKQQLEERDAILAEWMHSTEAFRRLARQYGKKIGIADEQRAKDYNAHALDIAEEDPKFANTNLAKKANAHKG